MKRTHLIMAGALACYVVVGWLLWPEWWNEFILGGGIFRPRFLARQILEAYLFFSFPHYYPPLFDLLLLFLRFLLDTTLTFAVVLFAVRLAPLDRLTIRQRFGNRRLVVPIAVVLAFVSLLLYEAMPVAVGTTIKPEVRHGAILEPPVAFRYTDDDAILSLFGQTAPELALASVRLERQETGKGEADAAISGIVGTSISREEIERRTIELTATAKTPARMVIELVNFLSSAERLGTFDATRPLNVSAAEERFTDARVILEERNVRVDSGSFSSARDQIRRDEITTEIARVINARGFAVVQAHFKQVGARVTGTYLNSSLGSATFVLSPGHEWTIPRSEGLSDRVFSIFGTVEGSVRQKDGVTVTLRPIAVW